MKIIKVFIIILLSIILTNCKKAVEIGTIVASVDVHNLTIEQLKLSYGEEEWDAMEIEEQREIINQWIDLTALYSQAIKNEMFKEDLALKFMAENAKKKVYANALIAHELENMQFSNDELYNYYRLREAEFTEQIREFRVQRIMLNSEEEMQNVKRMLDNRDIAFTPAAQRYSQENIGRNGGFMANFVTRTSPDSLLWQELDKVAQYIEVTMPLGNGWVIARWQEFRTTTANRSFYAVRSEIEQLMKEERKFDLYEQVLRDARSSSKVIILH